MTETTTWRDEARAMKAADPSLTYAEMAKRLGRVPSAVWKVFNVERTRELDRVQNKRRHGVKLAWQRERDHMPDSKAACSVCGGPCGAGSARKKRVVTCATCIVEQARPRREAFAARWREGATYPELCEEFDMNPNHVSKYIHDLRRLGFDVPYRYRVRANSRNQASA